MMLDWAIKGIVNEANDKNWSYEFTQYKVEEETGLDDCNLIEYGYKMNTPTTSLTMSVKVPNDGWLLS